MDDQLPVHRQMRTTTSLETVWEAWTDPERLQQWFCDQASGWPAVGSKLNLRFERFGFNVDYHIVELERLKRVVLRCHLPGIGYQFLGVTLTRRGVQTNVSLKETVVEGCSAEEFAENESAWDLALAVLKLYVERYFGRPRSTFFALLAAPFTYAQIKEFYTARLGEWLGTDVSFTPEVGQPYRLTLDDGTSMSGTVLAVTTHEVALSWDEIQGYLELKAIPVEPGKRAICLRGAGYGLAPEKARELEKTMEAAVVRLFSLLAGVQIT
ncbi:MAG: SRPBCC domain-containing protein [Candidatus Eremiobacterota bacterium]